MKCLIRYPALLFCLGLLLSISSCNATSDETISTSSEATTSISETTEITTPDVPTTDDTDPTYVSETNYLNPYRGG